MTRTNHQAVSCLWACVLGATLVAGMVESQSVTAAAGQAGAPRASTSAPQATAGRATTDGRAATDGRSNGRPGPGMTWEWWTDADVKKQLGLSDEKVKRIRDIYEANVKRLKPFADEFTRLRAELDTMTHLAVVDEATYSLQVWRVESLRSKLSESRTIMLYRISRELQPDQYKKLQDIINVHFSQGRGRGPEPRR